MTGRSWAGRTAMAIGASALLAITAAPSAFAGTRTVAPVPQPAPSAPTPGGLAPKAVPAAAGDGVHIVKRTTGTSCTGYSSQTTPPNWIRVLVHNSSGTPSGVVRVRFQDYVENVLPNEWIASWDAAALEAGAIAVRSYAWFWVNHYGGYYRTTSNCFDVTDDTSFQVYLPNSANPRTTNAVLATWNLTATKSGQVVQTFYRASLTTNPPGPEACGKGASGSTMSQYGSQACARAGYSFQRILRAYYSNTLRLSPTADGQRQLLMADDFALAGRSSKAVFEPSTGNWSIQGITTGPYHFGTAGDVPLTTNGGGGWADIGVFRPSTGDWYSTNLFFGQTTWSHWGTRGDIPSQAHYDGIAEPTVRAVFRPSNGRWYVQGHTSFRFGRQGDIPTPGHFVNASSDSYKDHAAVFRRSSGTWFVRGAGRVRWGSPHDIPVPADYNGDGTTDLAVYRPSNNTWYVRMAVGLRTNVKTWQITWGTRGDIPVTGDFNGDGRADVATYRPSNHCWYVWGQGRTVFGSPFGIPVGKAPQHG